MKKDFNNKGMTLVELIITFSLLMVVVVGMFNLILDIKLDMDDKQIIKSYIDYSSYYANTLNYDFVKNKPFMVFIKEGPDSVVCQSSDATGCSILGVASEGETPEGETPEGETPEATTVNVSSMNSVSLYCSKEDINNCRPVRDENFSIDGSSKATFSEMCRRIYPCLIGVYHTTSPQEPIRYMAVAINVPTGDSDEVSDVDAGGDGGTTSTTKEAPLDKSKYGLGINYYYFKGSKYQNVYEQIPNQSYVYIKDDAYAVDFGAGSSNSEEYGNSVSQNAVVIDFPIYKTGNDTNYGFKVVYPLVKQ